MEGEKIFVGAECVHTPAPAGKYVGEGVGRWVRAVGWGADRGPSFEGGSGVVQGQG